MREDDVDTAVSLTRFPCMVSGPMGNLLVNEDKFREMMAGHSGKDYEGVEMKNSHVEILNDETAVITYEFDHNGMTMIDCSTWVLQNGNWLCAFHSENPKMDH